MVPHRGRLARVSVHAALGGEEAARGFGAVSSTRATMGAKAMGGLGGGGALQGGGGVEAPSRGARVDLQ